MISQGRRLNEVVLRFLPEDSQTETDQVYKKWPLDVILSDCRPFFFLSTLKACGGAKQA
jgi:hypothetical protein